MAAPTLEEILLGGFIYFVENGTQTLDPSPGPYTVSSTVKPDTDPATNWTNFTLGDILNFKFEKEEADLSYDKPLPSGGFAKVNKKLVTQDSLVAKSRHMGELVNRLRMGFTGPIVLGTAQTPGLATDRKAEGWLRLQGRKLGGYDLFILDWWCEVRLEESDTFEAKVVEPVLRFTQIKGVAGNSCNFPA
jgi:hypothetical protein